LHHGGVEDHQWATPDVVSMRGGEWKGVERRGRKEER